MCGSKQAVSRVAGKVVLYSVHVGGEEMGERAGLEEEW